MRPASIALAVASCVLLSGWQFANADDPWSNERYQLGGSANSRQANQFGATIGSGANSATQTPSPLDRAQSAVVGTAGTLRDGVEAGIKQANQQLTQAGGQVLNGTTNAGRELGQQFQNVTGLGSQAQPQSATAWPAPPPSFSSATNTAPSNAASARPASSSGWTSIRSDMAPPTLLAPPLVPLASGNSTVGNFSSSTGTGPTFPPLSSNSSGNSQHDQFHSLLADPNSNSRQSAGPLVNAGQTTPKSPDWSSGWGSTAPSQATIESSSPPRVGPEIPHQPTSSFAAETDPWNRQAPASSTNTGPTRNSSTTTGLADRYGQPTMPSQNGASLWADLPAQRTTPSTNTLVDSFSNQPGLTNQPSTGFSNFPNQPIAGQANAAQQNLNPSAVGQNLAGQPLPGQPSPGQPGSNFSTLGFGNQNGPMGQQTTNQDQLPWLPLLVVSLALAGSFGANLYLGWSYADARHRYHSLVRRTTESFHKATGIAA